jgi:biopolymer transport protein ExbB/TolQ
MEGFSVIQMYTDANIVVKVVMWLLIFASLASWVVIVEKSILLNSVSRNIWLFKRRAKELESAVEAESFPGFTSLIVDSGVRESADVAGNETRADYRERVERAMRSILSSRVDRLQDRVVILATVGSTSPFIGLFGTVWGIMHSFIGIAATGETTLAVVAPGIAEALAATAMGLVAAIPAVVAFNKINSTIRKINKEAQAGISLVGNALARLRFSSLAKNPARAA